MQHSSLCPGDGHARVNINIAQNPALPTWPREDSQNDKLLATEYCVQSCFQHGIHPVDLAGMASRASRVVKWHKSPASTHNAARPCLNHSRGIYSTPDPVLAARSFPARLATYKLSLILAPPRSNYCVLGILRTAVRAGELPRMIPGFADATRPPRTSLHRTRQVCSIHDQSTSRWHCSCRKNTA